MMMPDTAPGATLTHLDDATRALVRLAAMITAGTAQNVRDALVTSSIIPAVWTEELILQTYLFAGFPRALNAMREWRRIQPAPVSPAGSGSVDDWTRDGEQTCATVYGDMYERLRENIEGLHPLLDEWMITEGYGKVLSRPGLDLMRRELCIVAACAAAGQERQLHSHLHGALNVGVPVDVVDEAVEAVADVIADEAARSTRMLWARVRGK
jgi:4-carboxymuconolactone decarboxylase